MIVYIFNQPFPDNSGFGRRCAREIEAISLTEEILVICRYAGESKQHSTYEKNDKKIRIIRFKANSEIVHRPKNYKSNGLYEIKRNLDLMFHLCFTVFKALTEKGNEKKHLYVVTSPLTVPLICGIMAKLCGVETFAVSFHDLEPELAMHIKKLSSSHWLVKVELWLESLICRMYKKIIVTTPGQAKRLAIRTHTNPLRICAIENSTELKGGDKKERSSSREFVLAYMSTISFDYTISGLLEFLATFAQNEERLQNLRILILGDGDGMSILKAKIKDLGLVSKVSLLGNVSDPASALYIADAAIVPWQEDTMTETMLPTKLFEYLSLKLPVFVPKFGEFKRLFSDLENAVFFKDQSELVEKIELLAQDKQLTKKIGVHGFDLYQKEYRPDVLNRKFIAFLEQP